MPHIRSLGVACAFGECGRDAVTKKRGLCSTHDEQARAELPLTPIREKRDSPITEEWISSFLRDAQEGCREWSRATTEHGYVVARENGSLIYLHRFVWESRNGPIPAGMVIDHMCGNRKCLNADHLNVVSGRQNRQHMAHLNARNKTGHRGVYQRPDGKYVAQCSVGGSAMYLGSFESAVEAGAAARAARIEEGYYEPSA